MHHDIAARTADLALASGDFPRRVLDVGCGTGLLLRMLAARLPEAELLVGIDAAAGMIATAKSMADDPRLSSTEAAARTGHLGQVIQGMRAFMLIGPHMGSCVS